MYRWKRGSRVHGEVHAYTFIHAEKCRDARRSETGTYWNVEPLKEEQDEG